MTLRTRIWPILTDNTLAFPAVTSRLLKNVRFVPADGSAVVLRVPRRLVYDTDPDATRRRFGATDILTVKLAGLEDDPSLRHVTVQAANRAGRTWMYEGLRTISGWGVLRWVFLAAAASIVGFFVPRWLKTRWPDPTPDKSTANASA
jgi:hypothetical protein